MSYINSYGLQKEEWMPKTNEPLKGTLDNNLPPKVASFFKDVKKQKWLGGGRKDDWQKIEELTEQWIIRAKKYAHSPIPTNIKRLSDLENIFKEVRHAELTLNLEYPIYSSLKYENYNNLITAKESMEGHKQFATRTIQLIILACSKEISDKKDDIATCEYEILKRGGWLIGFTKKDLLVYFPFPSEIIIKKLKNKK